MPLKMLAKAWSTGQRRHNGVNLAGDGWALA
jgi:hypothetical protein